MSEYYLIYFDIDGIEETGVILTRNDPDYEGAILYDIYFDQELMGTIYPAVDENGLVAWESTDIDIGDGYIKQLGALITEQDK
jgi:hypothetical protein